jgi:hypothetical protein
MSHVDNESLEAFRSKSHKSRLDELKNNSIFTLREDGNFEIKKMPEFGMRSNVTEFAKMMDHVIRELGINPEKNIRLYYDNNSKYMKLSTDSKPSTVMAKINKKTRDKLDTSENMARSVDSECAKLNEASGLMARLTGHSKTTELMDRLKKGSLETTQLMERLKNPPSNGISR